MNQQPLDLDQIEARANAAEDGWYMVADDTDPYRFEIHGDGPTHVAVFGGNPDDGFASYPVRENAEFAAHAREDVDAMAAEIRRLRTQVATARSEAFREAAGIAESLRQFDRTTGPRAAAQVSENVGILRVADELRHRADAAPPAQTDTLAEWLHWRFGPHGQPWSDVADEDKACWEHQARAVRRAVARGGFKPRAVPAVARPAVTAPTPTTRSST